MILHLRQALQENGGKKKQNPTTTKYFSSLQADLLASLLSLCSRTPLSARSPLPAPPTSLSFSLSPWRREVRLRRRRDGGVFDSAPTASPVVTTDTSFCSSSLSVRIKDGVKQMYRRQPNAVQKPKLNLKMKSQTFRKHGQGNATSALTIIELKITPAGQFQVHITCGNQQPCFHKPCILRIPNRLTHMSVVLLNTTPGILFYQCFHKAPRLLPVANI